jgi:hypothetical protein
MMLVGKPTRQLPNGRWHARPLANAIAVLWKVGGNDARVD